jgi:hypothetical protein
VPSDQYLKVLLFETLLAVFVYMQRSQTAKIYIPYPEFFTPQLFRKLFSHVMIAGNSNRSAHFHCHQLRSEIMNKKEAIPHFYRRR